MNYDRLYIIGSKHTHLAYISHHEDILFQMCLPNIPVMAGWSCKSDDDCFPAGIKEAEEWDTYYNEVTCPTCLRWARGISQLAFQEVEHELATDR